MDTYLGFIPNEQLQFVDCIRKVIQQQKDQQRVQQQQVQQQQQQQQQKGPQQMMNPGANMNPQFMQQNTMAPNARMGGMNSGMRPGNQMQQQRMQLQQQQMSQQKNPNMQQRMQ